MICIGLDFLQLRFIAVSYLVLFCFSNKKSFIDLIRKIWQYCLFDWTRPTSWISCIQIHAMINHVGQRPANNKSLRVVITIHSAMFCRLLWNALSYVETRAFDNMIAKLLSLSYLSFDVGTNYNNYINKTVSL